MTTLRAERADAPAGDQVGSRALVATFVCALALRLVHVWALAQTPFWSASVVDARGYEEDAQALFSHGTLGHAFYRPPLYGYIRAGLMLVGLGSPSALHVVHALLSAITATLLVGLTSRLCARQTPALRKRATWAASAIAVTYGPLVLTELELLPTVWVNALLASALVLASQGSARLTSRDCAAGLCLGLATVGWGHAVVFLLPVLMLRWHAPAPGQRARVACVLLLATASAPMLCAYANAREDEPGIVVSANLGINLWLGNAPRFRETTAAGPGVYYDREYQLPTRAGALTMRARERWYLSAVAEYVLEEPLAAFARTGEKILHLLHCGEIWRDQSLAWMRAQSPVASLLVWDFGLKFPFGLLLPLALVARREALVPAGWAALTLAAAAYVVSLAPFLVSMRYRTPLVLLLIPLAASAWADLTLAAPRICADVRVLARSRRGWTFALVLVAGNLPNPAGKAMAVSPAQQQIRLSRAYQWSGDGAAALASAERATELAPDTADAHDELGVLLLSAGQAETARVHFERAIELLPDSEGALIHHAHSLLATGALEQARESLRRAIAINPYHGYALGELARLERALGEPQRAAELIERFRAASYRRDR